MKSSIREDFFSKLTYRSNTNRRPWRLCFWTALSARRASSPSPVSYAHRQTRPKSLKSWQLKDFKFNLVRNQFVLVQPHSNILLMIRQWKNTHKKAYRCHWFDVQALGSNSERKMHCQLLWCTAPSVVRWWIQWWGEGTRQDCRALFGFPERKMRCSSTIFIDKKKSSEMQGCPLYRERT